MFGGLGTGIAWVVVTILNVSTLIFGTIWLLLGIGTYVLYRRSQGLSLTETTKVVMPKPIVEREVEYESVLVAFEGDDYSPDAVATAAKLAARRRRGIHLLVIITVPSSSPIDASMPEQESRAVAIIDSARVIGGRRVTGHWEKARAGEAGRRIVDEAREIRARAIVMSAAEAAQHVVAVRAHARDRPGRAPCRVIIESSPEDATPPGTSQARPAAAA